MNKSNDYCMLTIYIIYMQGRHLRRKEVQPDSHGSGLADIFGQNVMNSLGAADQRAITAIDKSRADWYEKYYVS